MRSPIRRGLLVIFSFSGLFLYAQEQRPLRELIEKIQLEYNVVINYLEDDLDHVYIKEPTGLSTFKDYIAYIQRHTRVRIHHTGANFYSIELAESTTTFLCGKVIARDSQKPIRGALIYYLNTYTMTDSEGNFRINSGDGVDVLIQHEEYQSQPYKLATSSECQKIALQPNLIELEEIIVTNYVSRGINKRIDGSISLDIETLDLLPGFVEPDVLMALQVLPGVQSVEENVSDINIRGGTNDQNLILWDGVKMYHTGHFFGLISIFNSHSTESAQLIKNGTTAGYGDGVSGTILIKGMKDIPASLRSEVGSNLLYSDVLVEAPVGVNSGFQIAARRGISDIWKTPTYRKYFARAFRDTEISKASQPNEILGTSEDFNFHDASLRFLTKIGSKDELRSGILTTRNAIAYEEVANTGAGVDDKISELSQGSLLGYVDYARRWTENLKSVLKVQLTDYHLRAVNFDVPNDQRLIQENGVLDRAIKGSIIYAPIAQYSLMAGMEYRDTGIRNLSDINNPSVISLSKHVLQTHSAFAEVNIESSNHLRNLTFGIRGNSYSNGEFTIEPRFVGIQKFSKYFTFELKGEMKSQGTFQQIDLQNDFLGVENRKWALASRELPVLRSKQLSAQLLFQKKNLLISIEGYVRRLQNLYSLTQGFQNQYQYTQTNGRSHLLGFDFLMNPQFENVNFWFSYSFLKSQYHFPQLDVSSFRSNYDITHTVNVGAVTEINRFEFSIGANIRSGKPYTTADENDRTSDGGIVYNYPNNALLDPYIRMDISARYHWDISNHRLLLGCSVWNVTNRKNELDIYYNLNAFDNVERFVRHGLGITPNISVRWIFNSAGK